LRFRHLEIFGEKVDDEHDGGLRRLVAEAGVVAHQFDELAASLAKLLRRRVADRRAPTWGRCYDFENVFAKKFCEKSGDFYSKQS
jgi:hypothetical protein